MVLLLSFMTTHCGKIYVSIKFLTIFTSETSENCNLNFCNRCIFHNIQIQKFFAWKGFSTILSENCLSSIFFKLLKCALVIEMRYFRLFKYQNLRTGHITLYHWFIILLAKYSVATRPTSCVSVAGTR